MTDQEINVAIAEACGVKARPNGWCVHHKTEDRLILADWHKSTCDEWLRQHPDFQNDWETRPEEVYPSYANDLNAMHEVELSLSGGDATRQSFRWHLWNRYGDLGIDRRAPCHATARQRAEAFLRVKGLWKD